MLSLLGSLLVQQFNNKSLDQSIRVTSVDYLGTVASTLRRDAVTSQLKEHDVDIILRELTEGNQSDSDEDEEDDDEEEDSEENDVQKEAEGTDAMAKKPPKKANVKKDEDNVVAKEISMVKKKMDRILVLRDAVLDYLLEDESDPVALASLQQRVCP